MNINATDELQLLLRRARSIVSVLAVASVADEQLADSDIYESCWAVHAMLGRAHQIASGGDE